MKRYIFTDLAKTWWAEYRVDGMLNSDNQTVLQISSKNAAGVVSTTDLDPVMVAIGLPNQVGYRFTEVEFKALAVAKNLNLTKQFLGAEDVATYAALTVQTAPTFSPVAGPIAFGATVTIASASADKIYYTLDGTEPTIASTDQSATACVIDANTKILRAIAVKAGKYQSVVGVASYTQAVSANLSNLVISNTPSGFTFAAGTYAYTGAAVLNAVATVTVTPTGSGVIKVNGVTVTSGQASGAITLDAGDPSSIVITVTETGKSVKTYTIELTRNAGVVGTPVLTPSAGAIAYGILVTITSADADAIYYTIDGSAPSAAKTLYTVPFAIATAETIKAIGITAGWDSSAIASEAYTQLPAAAPTVVHLTAGSVDPVGGVTDVALPVDGATDNTGKVTGWVSGSANEIKFTVTNAANTASTITINGAAYISGEAYVISAATTRTVVVTTTRTGYKTTVRTFTIDVAAAA